MMAIARAGFLTTMLLAAVSNAFAADRIYFPAVDTVVRDVLIQHINAETVRLDISSWYLSDQELSIAIANRFAADVPVRIIGDRASIFEIDPNTKKEFYWLASQGVPIRLRFNPTGFPELNHWKMALFVGQKIVEFGSANFAPSELVPISATNYVDDTVIFSDDQALVNAFRTKFDVMWNDTTVEPQSIAGAPPYLKSWNEACATEPTGNCADYRTLYPKPATMIINTARLEPNYPTPADLIWGQGPEFNNRLTLEINRETSRIDVALFRLEVDNITDALLSRFRAGVPVRIIVDTDQYTNITWPEYWLTHSNIDKLWAAGIPVLQRRHQGGMHLKMLVTSDYATNASSNFGPNWQRDHNYFVPAATKPAIYQAMADRFNVMWADAGGFAPLQPTPPQAANLTSPASEAMLVVPAPTLTWSRAAWAVSYDVYLGTSPSSLVLVGNVPAQMTVSPPETYSWTPTTPLKSGTKYWWKIVSRTNATAVNAALIASSTIGSFTTRGVNDFDGDGRSDVAVFRPSTGIWYLRQSSSGAGAFLQWGLNGDIPVAGDYDGDGRTDIAVFRPSTGIWYVRNAVNETAAFYQWGLAGDIPVPRDYDNDGKTDIAVFRPSTGIWYVRQSSNSLGAFLQWGLTGDLPVPGDYDGDGRDEIAVFRPSTGIWYVRNPVTGTAAFYQWGLNGDVPVPGDYDGDGRTDVAVFRPSTGIWYVRNAATETAAFYQWGLTGDIPVPGDYNGDGQTDVAVFRPSTGIWYIRNAANESVLFYQWGLSGDIPIPK